MVLWGSIVNGAAIIIGTMIGLAIPKMRDQLKDTVMQGMGIALGVLGIMMAIQTEEYLWMILSLVAGGMIGEWIGVERRFEQAGQWLESRVPVRGDTPIGKAFVTATLVFCIGAMAVLGPIDSGLRNDHQVLYTKSLMDGFLSVIFASTLGIGVMFSAIPILLYQGSIALAATVIASFFSHAQIEAITQEISAVGGILIIGISLNLLDIKKVNVANLLPSLLVMGVIMSCKLLI